MIEIIDGTWAAGETKTFNINGEYIELLDAAYQCDVFLMDKAGAQLSVMRKCEVSFFSKPSGGFNTVQITSTQAQYIRFFLGSGDAGTRRISSTVQVVDGGLRRTLAGVAFLGLGNVTSAGVSCTAQLWNPAGSGRNLLLKQVSVGSNTASGVNFAYATVAASSLSANPKSKLLGGVSGVGEVRVQNVGIATAGFQDSVYVQNVVTLNRLYVEPIVIPPGFGWAAIGSAVVMNVAFEWTEEVI